MELRRLSICIAFFLLAVATCSDGRPDYSSEKDIASAEDVNFEDSLLGDEPSEDETQNDADGGDGDDEEKEIPANILNKPESYNVTVGGTLRLECKPDGGHAILQWTKGDTKIYIGTFKTLTSNDRIELAPNSNDLIIRDLTFNDSGEYTCTILQDEPVSVTHKVVVGEAPKITEFRVTKNGVAMEGSDVEFHCKASGVPTPNIIWSRLINDENVRLTEKDASFVGNTMIIKNITSDKAGKYLCYALNNFGNHIAEYKVEVNSKPKVHVHRTVENSDINVEAVLQCMVHDDHSIPHFRWYKDDRLIEDTESNYRISTVDTRSNLTIIPRSDDEFGHFTCEAENKHGRHSRTIELVQRPVIEDLKVDGSQVTWRVHSYQPLEEIEVQLREINEATEWVVLSVPLPKVKDHEHSITYELQDKVDPGTYDAIVKVKNTKGWSNPTETRVEIETQPLSIQHASIFRGGNGSASIRPTITALSTILMYLLVRML